MAEEATGEYDDLPLYCGTINLLYSPEKDDLIEALEYPYQFWNEDEGGRYRVFIFTVHPEVTQTKYYLIGTL